MCSFTKFVVAWPIRDKKATTVARGLMEQVILPLGSFRELLKDNGKEFENELCHELYRLMGIERLRTTFYTSQCNGGIERWHSTMNSLLAKTVEVHQKDGRSAWHTLSPPTTLLSTSLRDTARTS